MTIANTDRETIQTAILDHVKVGSTLLTDEATAYAADRTAFGGINPQTRTIIA